MKFNYKICLAICFTIAIKTQAVQLHFGQWIKTDTLDNVKLYVFEMIVMQEVQNCIESCKAKKQCKFINFDHRANLCYHIGSKGSVDYDLGIFLEKKPGFSFGSKRDWNLKYYEDCDKCNEYGVCKNNGWGKYSKCRNSGCGPPEDKKNAIFLGNMFAIGNKIEYKCKEGYRTKTTVPVISTCLEDGTWSSVEFECLPGAVFGEDIYEFNNKYYKFMPHKQDWDAAKISCNQLHGNLVHITSQEEHDNMVGIIKRTDNSYECYWIGGRRINEEFSWLDRSTLANGYTNWYSGQPSSDPGEEDCVDLYETFDYMWNDAPCSSPCYFICEFI